SASDCRSRAVRDSALVEWYRSITHLAREGRMTVTIGRRELLAALGGATAWPLAARTQQPAMPVIGFISSRSPGESAGVVAAFQQGLREVGFVEGQNVVIAFRWAEGHYDRLPALAADLIGVRAAVLFAAGGPPSALAAKAAPPSTINRRQGNLAAGAP